VLGRRSEFITTESLADGTATPGERTMVLGIILLLLSFSFVFVGVCVMFVQGSVLCLALAPIPPGIVVYYALLPGWREYQRARQKHLKRPAASRREP
jgi:hypothetical protein